MEEDLAFTGRGTPEVLRANRVSAIFLYILGVSPLLGSGFTTPDTTVLISYNLWQHRFQGDFRVVGQTIDLAGTAYVICGVSAQNFAFPSAAIDVWLTSPEDLPGVPRQSRALSPVLTVFGRLNPGVTLKQATAEISVLQAAYARNQSAMLDAKPKSPPGVTPLHEVVVRGPFSSNSGSYSERLRSCSLSPVLISPVFCLPEPPRVPPNSLFVLRLAHGALSHC